MIYESWSEQETFEIGKKMAENAVSGQIYCLDGDLGVGKTVFSKGFAWGLGITEPVTSPTFTLVNEYEEGRLPLYHFDVYRIGCPDEMDEIGYEEYFYGNGVCLVEWSELIAELIPPEAYRITIRKNLEKGLDYREIMVEGGAQA